MEHINVPHSSVLKWHSGSSEVIIASCLGMIPGHLSPHWEI